jgi:predicted O-methyltransferase YrrM
MLFAPLKNKAICFGEIGVAGGRSALLWDMYFTNPAARINMFDRDENFLENARRMVGSRLSFSLMDVGVDGDVARALGIALYDVIIDDSSHNFYDQIRIIKEAWPMIRSGGMLIIEDVFRTEDEERYTNAIQEILSEAAMSYFVMCEHVNRWSPGWDNDKLLVLVKA